MPLILIEGFIMSNKIIITMSVCVDEDANDIGVVESIIGAVNELSEVIETRTVSQMVETNTMKDGDYWDAGVHYNESGDEIKPQKLKWDV